MCCKQILIEGILLLNKKKSWPGNLTWYLIETKSYALNLQILCKEEVFLSSGYRERSDMKSKRYRKSTLINMIIQHYAVSFQCSVIQNSFFILFSKLGCKFVCCTCTVHAGTNKKSNCISRVKKSSWYLGNWVI